MINYKFLEKLFSQFPNIKKLTDMPPRHESIQEREIEILMKNDEITGFKVTEYFSCGENCLPSLHEPKTYSLEELQSL